MNTFGYQLITLTYNHESCIMRHLNSIKAQVIDKSLEVYLTIVDDCSSDSNVSVIKNWIHKNRSLFIETDLIINNENLGTKETYLRCLKEIKYQKVKILAGDDLYINNIFRFLDYSADKPIVFSPSAYLIKKVLIPNVSLNLHLSRIEIINSIVKGHNPFTAPGVYINPKLITNDFLEYLSSHGDIFREDLPSWYYFFVIKKQDYFIYDSPVTIYNPSFINKETTHTLKLAEFIIHTFISSQFKRLVTKNLKKTTRKNDIVKQLKIIDSI